MGEALDRILLDALHDTAFRYDGRSFSAALRAAALLDKSEKRSVRRAVGKSASIVERPPKPPLPLTSEDEVLFGLLVLEDMKFHHRGQPADLANALRHRLKGEPATLPARALEWRSRSSFAMLKAYGIVPMGMRQALDRSLTRAGHPPLHDDPDALTFAKGLALAPQTDLLQRALSPGYDTLSDEEVHELIVAVADSQNSKLFRESVWWRRPLEQLAVLRTEALRRELTHLAGAGVFGPSEIYWSAGEAIARIVARHRDGRADSALLWTRHADSIKNAARGHHTRGAGAVRLFIESGPYAGVEISDNGEFRELALPRCRWLVRPERAEPDGSPHLRLLTPADCDCPGCGRRLTTLIDLDLTRPEFEDLAAIARADDAEAARLRIQGCLQCAYYQDPTKPRIVSDFDWRGAARLAENRAVEFSPDDGFEGDFVESVEAIVLTEPSIPIAALCSAGRSYSHVGGYPKWEQGPEYPECPQCRKRMLFVACVSMLQWDSGGGTVYGCICAKCRRQCIVLQLD